jgi:capsular exopolysaccharide synthesis family protein
MTNEIQFAGSEATPLLIDGSNLGSRLPAQYTGNLQPPPPAQPEGLKRLHQLLRGRYKWAISLGLIFGIVGACLGVWSQRPIYKATAQLMIPMTMFNPNSPQDSLIVNYGEFVRSQMTIMSSKEQIERALELPDAAKAWKDLGRPITDAAIDQFADNLEVMQANGSMVVQVNYFDPDPKAAQAGASAICDAYVNYISTADPQGTQRRYEYWDRKRTTVGAQLATANLNLSNLTEKYGTSDLGQLLNQDLLDTNRLKHDYEAQASELAGAEALLKNQASGAATTAPAILSYEQIAEIDRTMAALLLERQQAELRLDEVLAEFGSQHIQVRSARENLAAIDLEIQGRAADFNQHYTGLGLPGGAGLAGVARPLTQADVEQMRLRVNRLKDLWTQEQAETDELGRQNTAITEVKARIASLTAQSDEANRMVEAASTARPAENRLDQIEIYSRGKVPTEPSYDRRRAMGAVGFMFGALLPAGFLILLGLLDSRFRYSDEATGESSGAPLLGTLPNLPDLLTDPEQAAIAAHCVHQIRTLLQINGATFGRSVFAITSANAGDGKTSLTLALGLSFAASGSRTLVIDCDLVGAGLTARLNVNAPQGILEAMASRNIMDFIKPTEVTDLSILPVGEALGSYTGTISPAAVRRLVDAARARFDTVLIDTGPVLGSIEASPVAVAADAIILCVSRGSQRPMVDKTMAHLATIGARMAGVVFNRAESKDFERSMSRMSVPAPMNGHANGNGNGKSRPAGDGTQRIGPVAKAVASSVKTARSRN